MKIGLLFGSFNPIHNGHMAIANYMARYTGLDRVWLVVSPHNPFKMKSTLADAKKRLARVKKVIGRNVKIKVSDIEFTLAQPSYTIHTLDVLKKKYPECNFSLIIGADNLRAFHKWKDYKKILAGHKVYVYPRPGYVIVTTRNHRNLKLVNAPRFDISSTSIRDRIKGRKSVKHLIPEI